MKTKNFQFKLTAQIGNNKMTIFEFIDYAKSQGFEVYAPEKLTSYFYITKENKIGYCENNNLIGPKYSTVHKPNKESGTGFVVDNMQDTLIDSPQWAGNLSNTVIKYKSIDDFIVKHWQKLIKY